MVPEGARLCLQTHAKALKRFYTQTWLVCCLIKANRAVFCTWPAFDYYSTLQTINPEITFSFYPLASGTENTGQISCFLVVRFSVISSNPFLVIIFNFD